MCAAVKAHNVPRQHGSIELGIKHTTATSPKPVRAPTADGAKSCLWSVHAKGWNQIAVHALARNKHELHNRANRTDAFTLIATDCASWLLRSSEEHKDKWLELIRR